MFSVKKSCFKQWSLGVFIKQQLFENQFYERILEFFHNFEQKNKKVSKNCVFWNF